MHQLPAVQRTMTIVIISGSIRMIVAVAWVTEGLAAAAAESAGTTLHVVRVAVVIVFVIFRHHVL